MTEPAKSMDKLLDTPGLADALASDRFRQFLDHVPVAVAVAELQPAERITYANAEFERLIGVSAAELEGKRWDSVIGTAAAAEDDRTLSEAVADDTDYLGAFRIERAAGPSLVDAWANIIEDDGGTPLFRLLALAAIRQHDSAGVERLQQRVRDKDVLLRELQHRVKNNLQMITALIRHESRSLPGDMADELTEERFGRLAGRVESLGLLYAALTENELGGSVDLGAYLSQVASAVMQAHAVEGIRLNLQVDTWPVSINVAMPTGLVVNELLTNALKHAFVGRPGGTITLRSLVDETGCRITLADDGVGFPDGETWPSLGKLSALIVESLRQNAKAEVAVSSAPGQGVSVTITFARPEAAAKPA